MNKLAPNKFGLAFGIESVLFYVGCILLMRILSDETLIVLTNSLIHRLDVSTLLRFDITILESLIGLIITFILG